MGAFDLAADEEGVLVGELDFEVLLVLVGETWEFTLEDIGMLGLVDVEVGGEGSTSGGLLVGLGLVALLGAVVVGGVETGVVEETEERTELAEERSAEWTRVERHCG